MSFEEGVLVLFFEPDVEEKDQHQEHEGMDQLIEDGEVEETAWGEYCSDEYGGEFDQLVNCVEEDLIQKYFEEPVQEDQEGIAESLCQYFYNTNYNEEGYCDVEG